MSSKVSLRPHIEGRAPISIMMILRKYIILQYYYYYYGDVGVFLQQVHDNTYSQAHVYSQHIYILIKDSGEQ